MKNFQFSIFNFQNKKGFTLLETVIALSVIIGTLVGPVTLVTRGLASATSSKNKIIALHLAQEGIELARAVRDNNILCDSLGGSAQWDDNPSGGKLKGTYRVDVKSFTTITCGSGTGVKIIQTPTLTSSYNVPLNLDVDGFYTYMSGTPTGFTRKVQICSPPSSSPCNETNDSDISSGDQMSISSTVTWNERGNEQSVTLEDRLFHWQ